MLTEEIGELSRRRVDLSGLRISANAHLIMPYHKLLDHAGEAELGKLQIGTTRRGIGPCYADKAARLGIRMQDLLDEKILRKKIYAAMEPKRLMLRPFAKDPELDLHTMTEEYRMLGHRLEPYIADTAADRLARARRRRPRGLRGRAGRAARHRPRHLSVRHLVQHRSRAPPASAPAWGRARSTRSGASPRPTPRAWAPAPSRPSSTTTLGERIREAGGEFGTTTGRARRTGWLDLVALRYATRINGLTGLVMTKLDVLTGIDPLHVAVRYLGPEGATFEEFPYHQSIVHKVRGDLVELPGWHEDITGVPLDRGAAAQRPGLPRLHRPTSSAIPIVMVGVGPARDEMIWTGAAERAAARCGLGRSGLDHVRGHDHVVQRAVLVVPQRPEHVQEPGDDRDDRARRCPNSSSLTTTSRSAAQPNPTLSPLSRTTRIPTICLPQRLAVVGAVAGHQERRVEEAITATTMNHRIDAPMIAQTEASLSSPVIPTAPAISTKNRIEAGMEMMMPSMRAAPTRLHQPASG